MSETSDTPVAWGFLFKAEESLDSCASQASSTYAAAGTALCQSVQDSNATAMLRTYSAVLALSPRSPRRRRKHDCRHSFA